MFKIKRWKGQNLTGFRGDKNVTPHDKNVTPHDKNVTPHDKNVTPSFLEPAQESSFEDRQCTNNRSKRSLKQQNREEPPTHPVQADSLRSINSEGFGTRSDLYKQELEALLELVKAARVRPNQTIQETILQTLCNEGAAAGTKTVENAISSLEEARAKGVVKNPGGFLVAALRAKFTSNEAKKEARHKQQDRKSPPFNEIEMQIDSYLLNGRRDWALNKLQSLWDEGLHDPVEAVCTLRSDWRFGITAKGVSDAAD
ncbi:MAG: hypothetical protein KME27_23170 [Lyngbya sp. HA4199-MV5]|jgi:hypothetical protein|nr:hypothetical protein [Lyngbya sp. HA4199-MV5]